MNLDDLNKKLGEASESANWIPGAEQDTITGKVLAVGSFTHSEYGTSKTLTVDATEGSIMDGKSVSGPHRVMLNGAVLKRFGDEENPSVDDEIAIRYSGKKQGSGSFAYRNYATLCEKAKLSDKLADSNF